MIVDSFCVYDNFWGKIYQTKPGGEILKKKKYFLWFMEGFDHKCVLFQNSQNA